MSGTDPTTPHPTESGAPGQQPVGQPASIVPTRSPAPAVHVGGPDQAAPDDAPTSLMPALTVPAPAPPAYEPADATRVAAPVQQQAPAGGMDATQYLPPATPQAAATATGGAAPTRTPSYATRRQLGTPPGGPYGGLYAGPLPLPDPQAQADPEATQVATQAAVPPPPPAPAPQPVAQPDVVPAPPVSRPAYAGGPSQTSGVQHTGQRTETGRSGGGLGRVEPRVAVLGGIVGVLVVVAVVLGFTLFGGSDSPTVVPASAAAKASAGTADAPAVTERFASPSRNIACTVTSAEATCSIANLAKKPAPVDGCDGTVGYVAKVASDGTVTTPCVAHRDKPHAAPKSEHVLSYGESVSVGNLACTSSETGVRCLDKSTGKGFTIARAGIGGV
ncbi:hypothetical protein ACFT5B_03415 [Luteimicrobium sp. NPDC057192]|uniref:hypothetical protein n=1 Tax=Luteimicrobium sp. NPDC057192 TaxID=3346042 RepID=UPI003636E805